MKWILLILLIGCVGMVSATNLWIRPIVSGSGSNVSYYYNITNNITNNINTTNNITNTVNETRVFNCSSSNSYLWKINFSDGTNQCAPDSSNSYTNGTGLSLVGSTFSLLDVGTAFFTNTGNFITSSVATLNNFYNKTDSDSRYYNISNPQQFINLTGANIYNDTPRIDANNISLKAYIDTNNTAQLTLINNNNATKAGIASSAVCTYGISNYSNGLTSAGITCATQQGTVTSIAFTYPWFTTSTITSTGTIAFNVSQSNAVYVNRSLWTSIDNYPTDCSATQGVRGIGDTLTCYNINSGNTLDALNITSGTLPVARGGTGVTVSTGTTYVVLNDTPTIGNPLITGNITHSTTNNCDIYKNTTGAITFTVCSNGTNLIRYNVIKNFTWIE